MNRNEEQARLFVAIDLPQAWKQALAQLQDAMRATLAHSYAGEETPRLRWTRPEGIHLTLKFLGETPLDRLEAIETALASAVPAPPGFALGLGRAGSFSDRRAPRVLLATVTGEAQPLQALATSIDTWLGSAGFPREQRAFQPHLTLARLPDGLSTAQRLRIAELTNDVPAPQVETFEVRGVSLIRSYLGPGGARYEQLETYPRG